jgi:hypothetical protein
MPAALLRGGKEEREDNETSETNGIEGGARGVPVNVEVGRLKGGLGAPSVGRHRRTTHAGLKTGAPGMVRTSRYVFVVGESLRSCGVRPTMKA